MNPSEMVILPQTLLKIVVDEVGWSKKFFSKKVIQNLSKTVSIVILRLILAEISILVTRVVKPLTTKVHPTVEIWTVKQHSQSSFTFSCMWAIACKNTLCWLNICSEKLRWLSATISNIRAWRVAREGPGTTFETSLL